MQQDIAATHQNIHSAAQAFRRDQKMQLSLSEVPAGIEAYFDDEQPLGPVAADYISDEDIAAYLVTLELEASRDLTHGASILFGRKGAGKSSTLKSFGYRGEPRSVRALSLSEPSPSEVLENRAKFLRQYKLVLDIDSAPIIETIYERLATKALKSPEAAAREWRDELWLRVLRHVLKKPSLRKLLSDELQTDLASIADDIASLGIDMGVNDYFDLWLQSRAQKSINPSLLISRLHKEFIERDISGLLLIDSMEEYDLEYDDVMKKTIGGLLQLVATEKNSLHFKIAFPEEVYDQVRQEANPEKYVIRSTRIAWRPIELLRILTNRMLICFYIHETEQARDAIGDKASRARERERLLEFWDTVFGGSVVNEAGNEEAGIYFILRHTQMLPRQVINSMSELLKTSKPATRSFSKIDRSALNDAVRRACDQLIGGVESGFKYTYKDVREAFGCFLPQCPMIATYDELNTHFQRAGLKKKPFEWTDDFPSFLRAVLHMGTFGVIEDESRFYINARFGYSDDTVLRSSSDHRFVLHPAFSLLYKDPQSRLQLKKAVLPRGALDELPLT